MSSWAFSLRQRSATAPSLVTTDATGVYARTLNPAVISAGFAFHHELWGTSVFTFIQASGLTFNAGANFQFKVDPGSVGAAVIDSLEPSSMVLLGLGLAALFLRKKLQVS